MKTTVTLDLGIPRIIKINNKTCFVDPWGACSLCVGSSELHILHFYLSCSFFLFPSTLTTRCCHLRRVFSVSRSVTTLSKPPPPPPPPLNLSERTWMMCYLICPLRIRSDGTPHMCPLWKAAVRFLLFLLTTVFANSMLILVLLYYPTTFKHTVY